MGDCKLEKVKVESDAPIRVQDSGNMSSNSGIETQGLNNTGRGAGHRGTGSSRGHRGGEYGVGRGRGVGFNHNRGGNSMRGGGSVRGGFGQDQNHGQYTSGQLGSNRGGRDGGASSGARGGKFGGVSSVGGGGGGVGGFNIRFDRIMERLASMQGTATYDIPAIDFKEKKFSGRARLYVGNIAPGTKEDQIKEMMSQYGEVGEIFYNAEKNFAFLRLVSRAVAEKAKRDLDGQMQNGRPLRVRFAPHQGAVKVSNLGCWVTNELLHYAFSVFGDIERCLVYVDERGRPKGEGYIEFERKPSAQEAVKRCQEGCFFLTASLRPVVAELAENNDDDDGLLEKNLPKRSQEYMFEREQSPRFAIPATFEFEYGQKWKSLHDLKRQRLEALDREMKLEEDKLIAQMEYARYEHETEQLRSKLQEREAMRDRQKNQFEESERRMKEMLRQEQERRQRDEERLIGQMQGNDNNLRKMQHDNSLFVQAQELNKLLDQANVVESVAGGPRKFGGASTGGTGLMGSSPKTLMMHGSGSNPSGFGSMMCSDQGFGDFGSNDKMLGGGGFGSGFGNSGGFPRGGWNNDGDISGSKRRKY